MKMNLNSVKNYCSNQKNINFFDVCTCEECTQSRKGDAILVQKGAQEIEDARNTVIEALNIAYLTWKHKTIRNTTNIETLAMVDKTHKLVVDYISAMLSDKDNIPLVGV